MDQKYVSKKSAPKFRFSGDYSIAFLSSLRAGPLLFEPSLNKVMVSSKGPLLIHADFSKIS